MTVAIAIQVNDGVVLASDSAMTVTDPSKTGSDNILNVYNNANKIYNLRKGLPIGGMAYGAGSIGASSISTLAKDLRARFSGSDPFYKDWHIDPSNYTIEGVANQVRKFLFEETYGVIKSASPSLFLGFVIAGYSSGEQLSETWLVAIENGDSPPPTLIMGKGVCSWYAGGDPDVCCRIGNGFSQRTSKVLKDAGFSDDQVETAITALAAMAEPLVSSPMPIQDTIDLGEFLVHATACVSRFRHGAAMVGGPIESAAITKHEGFKWVK